jgi:hypothetical protein
VKLRLRREPKGEDRVKSNLVWLLGIAPLDACGVALVLPEVLPIDQGMLS